MRPTGIHRVYPLLILTALFFRTSIVAATAQRGSDEGVREASSARISELLSDAEIEDSEAIKAIFKFGDKAVPALVGALKNRKGIERGVWALAYLAGAKERKILLDTIPRVKDKEMKLFMLSFLAGALVEPASEEEWNFLTTCIKRYKYEDQSIASFYATLALGENGSQKALRILQSVQPLEKPHDPYSDVAEVIEEMDQARRWITGKSANNTSNAGCPGPDAEKIKQIVLENAFYEERNKLSVQDLTFTDDQRRVLVSVDIYRGPKNAGGYDIVLEHRSDNWRIVGIWVTWVS